MEKGKRGEGKKHPKGKCPGSDKISKTESLEIHETVPIKAENVPEGSTFKGHKPFIVQGLKIEPHNIRYLLERWQTPDGNYVEGKLPPAVTGHFSPELNSYILYQYYQCHVTQPLLLEQLHEFDIKISSDRLTKFLWEVMTIFTRRKMTC